MITEIRNDGFTNERGNPREFGKTDFEKDVINGKIHGSMFANYFRILVPVNPLTKKPLFDTAPKISEEFKTLQTKSAALSSMIARLRFVESLVFLNGRRVPGIFDGFNVSGGTIVEKLDEKIREAVASGTVDEKTGQKTVLPKLKPYELTFNIDKGIKPFTGSAKFIFLDDDYSTALEKSREFMRIITYWQDGVDASEGGTKRLFRIESFLVGADRPFNFSVIRITDFGVDMAKGIEGRLDGHFSFEQHAVFMKEATYRKPDSAPNQTDTGVNINELSIDENPVVSDIDVPSGSGVA